MLVVTATLFSVICSLLLAWYMTTVVRGRNYSDVGVIMYEGRSIAFAVGILGFPVFLSVFLLVIKQTLSKNSNLPYRVGIPFAGFCLIFYIPLLLWVYG